MNNRVKISEAAIDAGIRYLRSDTGMSEAILVQGIFDAMSAAQPADMHFDVEAMLAACVPGGSIVDPQVVADNIRAWVAELKPAELAEQQGVDAHTLWAMAQLAPGEGIEDGVQRIEEALAATGKQQVGENPAWRDELVREAHALGLMEGLNSSRQVNNNIKSYGYSNFELWLLSDGWEKNSVRKIDGDYAYENIAMMSKAWQAACQSPAHGIDLTSVQAAATHHVGIQLHVGKSALSGKDLWHSDGNGRFWSGQHAELTPQQLWDECHSILNDLRQLADEKRDAAPEVG